MAVTGPTQGAERHEAVISRRWTSRPWLARILRVAIVLVPLLLSFAFTLVAGRVAPADELGINRWLWIFVVFLLANALLFVLRTAANRLIPLVALMKLTLVFPDNAPSRTRSALRRSNSRTLLRNMEEDRAKGLITGETVNGDYLVQLLKEINDHDRLTRGHSERVRAYADLLGSELDLSERELNKLRWAALLHDVGKLTVPAEILNKQGRPDDEEWKVLQEHPTAGMELLEPLRGWLGDWIHAADQHHCRWDGTGYPSGLAGHDISLAGRIVAIADAYDVMTSTRSYKPPLSAEAARQELTDCAGRQFDPELVRTFLQVGLGRLQTVAGPFAWLTNLGGAGQLQVPTANTIANIGASAGAAAVAVAAVATSTVFGDPTPDEVAPEPQIAARAAPVDEPEIVVTALDQTIGATAGSVFAIALEADGPDLAFDVGGAAHGETSLTAGTKLTSESGGTQRWAAMVLYEADAEYVGQDAFSFEACEPGGRCDQGVVRIDLSTPSPGPVAPPVAPTTTTTSVAVSTDPPVTTAATTTPPPPPVAANASPIPTDDRVTLAEDTAGAIAVLDNDRDPDGDALTISGVGQPLHGVAEIDGALVRFRPDRDFSGTDRFVYTVTDGRRSVSADVTVTLTPVNDAPIIEVADVMVPEDVAIGSVVASSVVVDPDDSEFQFKLTGASSERFTIDGDGVVRVAAALDRETDPFHDLDIAVTDGDVAASDALRVGVADVDEAPVAGDDSAVTDEDRAVDITISANDGDPEGLALVWTVPDRSTAGGTLVEDDGVVRYVPPRDFNGQDTFTYTAVDPGGHRSSRATVTVAVGDVNDVPVAADDGGVGFRTDEDIAFTTGDITANDVDADQPVDPTSIAVTSGPRAGTLSVNADGTVAYTPDRDANGADTFAYTVTDARGATSEPATVTIVVSPVNDAPIANDDTVSVLVGRSATTVDLRLNDRDVDGDVLEIVSVSDGAFGTVADNGDGTVTYTHDGGPEASDSFTYTVEDPVGAGSTATVAVTISSRPDFDGVGLGDNCPIDFNPAQFDTDGDGLGDVCDPTPTVASAGNLSLAQTLTVAASVDVAAADLDGDGDLDIVFANDGGPNTVHLADDAGQLVSTGQNLGGQASRGVAVADFDGDGDVDLAFANDSGANRIWLNDGAGVFTATAQGLGNERSHDVVAGDVNGDGTVDLVFTNFDQPDSVWLNSGPATFVQTPQSLGSGPGEGIAIGDLDDDDDLDLVFVNDGADDTVWLNDGTGTFVDSGQTLGTGRSHAGVLADLDRDGDLDLAIAGDDDGDTVWLNDGTGGFTVAGATIGLGHSRSVDAGDIDGDGDLDLVFGDHVGPNSIWTNDGAASFSDSGNRIGSDATEGGVLADLVGDGHLGYVTANAGDANRHDVNS